MGPTLSGGHNHHLGDREKPQSYVALARGQRVQLLGGGLHSLGGRLQEAALALTSRWILLRGTRLVRTASAGSFTGQSLSNLRHLQGLTVCGPRPDGEALPPG